MQHQSTCTQPNAMSSTVPWHFNLPRQTDHEELVQRAERNFPYHELASQHATDSLRRCWYKAVGVVRTTKRGWLIDTCVSRLAASPALPT